MAPPPNPPSARHHPATPPRRRNARNLTRMPWTKCTLTCWAASSDRYLLSVTSALVFRDSYYSLKHLNHIFESIMFDFFCKTIWQAPKRKKMPWNANSYWVMNRPRLKSLQTDNLPFVMVTKHTTAYRRLQHHWRQSSAVKCVNEINCT